MRLPGPPLGVVLLRPKTQEFIHMANIAKGSLPPAGQRLVELMQRLHFGQILGLHVRAGQPVLNPLPRLVRDHKLGSEPAPRPASASEDFLLKEQVVELFDYFEQVGDGVIDLIEIKHGLPFRIQHTGPSA
jgi:hypothetical protein